MPSDRTRTRPVAVFQRSQDIGCPVTAQTSIVPVFWGFRVSNVGYPVTALEVELYLRSGDPRISDVGCPVTTLELDLYLCIRNPKILDVECPVTALELDL